MPSGKAGEDGTKLIAQNRKARHDYFIEETLEAGLVLRGTEVKACREGRASLADAYAIIEEGEAWLLSCHIGAYSHGNTANHDPERRRKLLFHKKEIDELEPKVAQGGRTLVPLRLYFKHGLAKAEIAVARGKRSYDRRRDIAKRDAERRMRQELGRRR
jgi:SsrA-binding protein